MREATFSGEALIVVERSTRKVLGLVRASTKTPTMARTIRRQMTLSITSPGTASFEMSRQYRSERWFVPAPMPLSGAEPLEDWAGQISGRSGLPEESDADRYYSGKPLF